MIVVVLVSMMFHVWAGPWLSRRVYALQAHAVNVRPEVKSGHFISKFGIPCVKS